MYMYATSLTHSPEVCVPGPTLLYFSWDREKCYCWCTFQSEFVTASNPFLILSPNQVVNSISICIGMNSGRSHATFLCLGYPKHHLPFPEEPLSRKCHGEPQCDLCGHFSTSLLFVQVPASQFPGYVKSVVEELYALLHAALDGSLTGDDTLGTVLLPLLSFLPSGMYHDQPMRL